MTRVLIVDDQASVRISLRHMLERYADIEVVAEAASGPEAIDAVHGQAPDVILMDLRMPDGDGIAATQILTAPPWNIPVLAITAFDIDEYVFGAIKAGAVGFLLKISAPDTYATAVRAAARGEGMISPQVTPRVLAAVSHTTRPASTISPDVRLLTAREVEIMRALADGPSSTKAVARRLNIEPASVKGHLKRIMAKLGLSSRAELVTWAFRNGVIS
ncbi:response regulator [Brooklawnia cerclae]|nr:response regulator transcription factor [Brooklawnia cerclae]